MIIIIIIIIIIIPSYAKGKSINNVYIDKQQQ